MSLLVVGSVAYDSVRTPAGTRDRALGGSAVYFSVAASCFADVSLVGIVGEDFDQAHVEALESRGVDVSGLERAEGKTFHWAGVYSSEDVNQRETLDTQLNVFEAFDPTLSAEQREDPISCSWRTLTGPSAPTARSGADGAPPQARRARLDELLDRRTARGFGPA